jgi:type IV pilus assembly protein PilA
MYKNSRSPSTRLRSTLGGFTQLEAVAAIAVTVLIGALGVAALRTFLVRGQVTESIAFAKYAQDQVTVAFRRNGIPPADLEDAGLGDGSFVAEARYIGAVRVIDGRIDLVFGGEADQAIAGRTLPLTPFETADLQVIWVCGTKPPEVGLKPLGFAGGADQAVQAPPTVEPRYLPRACR